MYASRMRKPIMEKLPRIFIHSLLGCIQSYLSFTEPDWVDVKHEEMNRDIDCVTDIYDWGLYDAESDTWTELD